MNQNSNIRRIDELGRIVIPKDIRKKLHIKENEPLEIFINSEEIHIKKYSSLPDIIEYIKYLTDMGNRITSNKYIVTDRDHIIAATAREYIDESISSTLENLVLNATEKKNEYISLPLSDNFKINANVNLYPLIIDNDRTGLIIEYNDDKPVVDDSAIKIFKNLIEKNLNNYWYKTEFMLY